MLLLDLATVALRPAYICAALGAYVVWMFIYALYFSPLRNVPGSLLFRASWIPMRVVELFGAESALMHRHYERYGSVFVLEPHMVALCDASDCTRVFSTHAFRKGHYYDRVEFLEPNIFFTTSPDLNSQRRRQIGPALQLRNLLHMEPTILSAGSDQLLTKWNQAIDMAGPDGRTRVCFFEDLMLMAFDVMTSLSFGQAHRSLTTGERHVLDMVRQCLMLVFLEEFAPIVKHPLVNWLIRPIHAQVDKFFAFIMDNINARRRLLESGAEKPKDILQEFLDAEDPDSKVHMTPSQVRTEAIVNVVAGSDTSALTLSWTLHLLMLHPHCLKLVVDEVRSAFPAGHTIRFEEAKEKLPYLEACLYESMRIRPVAGNLPRVIPSGGATFQGHFIPGGYSCAVSIAVVNSNKDAWANHDVFDPERFLDNPDNKRKMVTFSAGVRICPGRHLAWWNMTTALANIINSYDIALPDDALFTPNKLGANGQPVIMPERYNIIRFPKHPKRDCVALISKRAV